MVRAENSRPSLKITVVVVEPLTPPERAEPLPADQEAPAGPSEPRFESEPQQTRQLPVVDDDPDNPPPR